MQTLARLFGRSPFAFLKVHMAKVAQCVEELVPLFKALERKDYKELAKIAQRISTLEHEADLTKDEIRNNLPSGLFLPIARTSLLEILSYQDCLADRAEDTAVLLSLRNLEISPVFAKEFKACFDKNLETFVCVNKIIQELDDLLESSFGGTEADRVRKMVELVAFKEHEADLLQHKLLRIMFSECATMNHVDFFLWMKIFQEMASLSDESEKLANRIRMTLEAK